MSSPTTAAGLAGQLAALTDEQALDLLDTLASLRERADKAREERARAEAEKAAAEAERDACYPRCACGKPATLVLHADWASATVTPGLGRPYVEGLDHKARPLRGGMVALFCDNGQPSPLKASVGTLYYRDGDGAYHEIDLDGRALWVTCDHDDCGKWAFVPDGFARIVDWE